MNEITSWRTNLAKCASVEKSQLLNKRVYTTKWVGAPLPVKYNRSACFLH